MENITFANPEYFYLFIILPLFIAWYIWRQRHRQSVMSISTAEGFKGVKPTWKQRFRHLLFVLRILLLALLIVIIARPQSSSSRKNITTEGIDIVLAIDISGSMLAEDFKPNRMEAAKETAVEFIDERINDRIGLTVFKSKSFTQCPVTIDHNVLKNIFKDISTKTIDEDGTAIGEGLANAVSRLKDSKAVSRVVILLTDGVNNTGSIAPLTAAEIAKTFGIRVYTIGVGSKGMAPYPVQTPFGTRFQNMKVEIDEGILKEISSMTNGKYFRATDNKSLEKIYQEIDKMEKTKIDESIFSRCTEEFLPFALAAAALFLLELLLRYTVFRKIP